MRQLWLVIASIIVVSLGISWRASAESLANYQKQPDIYGNISSVGSDTLSGMMTLWVEEFNHLYPGVTIQVQASGSATAPPALTEGTAQIGPMSRPMRQREIDAFVAHYGYKPTQLKVAIDAIGIYINRDNPIQGLTISQLDSIYSATLRCGAKKPITTWSQLGLSYQWAKRSIQLFGRNSASGTYGYFKDHALCGGDYKSRVNALPGSSSVIQSVASAINTIGYSGVGYRSAGVRMLPIARSGQNFISPTQQHILSGEYPLSRYLFVYVNKAPDKPLPKLVRQFLLFIYSKQGQSLVDKDGYVPVSEHIAQAQLAKVGIIPKP
ncbi:PstS family phosphate ABC transporter substrate-binding protein [Vibrio sp. S4M6]|uniref:PstS family phosphate ABC transporter substrate-binding protein n=1 Tax=Vibrio sinus TaxID=2946865 RepID=UPI00202A7052|nr:PstS family phosphate ABC transporter substrate-binding protein [Vibrio sinus]MCL9782243.1 PstS family phosphate ABC transporter substrate-binding protein [Vibrio sinus]